MEHEAKEQLVRQFRSFLEQDEGWQDPEASAPGATDLFSLFTELAALRSEVKLESRQVKGAIDRFQELFATLEADNRRLARELDQCREMQSKLRRQAERELLLEILDLRDRLQSAVDAMHRHRPSAWTRLSKHAARFSVSLKAGLEMTLRRLDQMLAARRVKAVDVVDQPLDPHTMRAAHVERHPERADGIVVGELRKGYLWDDELLRLAEVVVSKRTEQA